MNPASSTAPFGISFGGVEPTSLAQPFPSYLGLSSGPSDANNVRVDLVPVLSMNCSEITRIRKPDNGLLSTALFTNRLVSQTPQLPRNPANTGETPNPLRLFTRSSPRGDLAVDNFSARSPRIKTTENTETLCLHEKSIGLGDFGVLCG